MAKEYLFVGYTTRLAPNYEQFLEPVQAAANLKDPVKIAEDIAKRKAKQADDALTTPLTAEIAGISILNQEGALMAEYDSPSKEQLGLLMDLLDLDPNGGPCVYGFGVREGLAILGLQAIAAGTVPTAPGWLCFRRFPAPPLAIDPFEQLLGSEQKNISLATLYQALLHTPLRTDFETNARVRAETARQLTLAAGLIAQ